MTDEMEYMSISQYCLNLIKNNVKLFLETKYKSIMEKEYKSSEDSFYDVMFYFNVLKKYLDEITELPKVIINTIYNLKIFRNKIAHQVPITLREFYRFVDDTQVILEMLNICDKNEIIKIQNTRKEIINRMNILDDNNIIIGSSYNVGNNGNNIQNNLNIKNFKSDSDIEMKDFDDDDYDTNKKENSGINYNDFINKNNKVKNINVKDKKEEERMKKINENYKIIMSNSDKNNFMQVKRVDLSKIE
jgi:hypothetical protein